MIESILNNIQQFNEYQNTLAKKEEYGCIYLITDQVIHDTSLKFNEESANILQYIGKHCQTDPKGREKGHKQIRKDYKGSRIDATMSKRPNDFITERIGVFTKEACLRMEAYYAEQFETYSRSRGNHRDGYNINMCGERGRLGIKHTDETKKILHDKKLQQSLETRKKNADAQRGKKRSVESITKLKETLSNPEMKERIGSANRGKKFTEEQMKPAREGNKLYWTPEKRAEAAARLAKVNEARKAPIRHCSCCNYTPPNNCKTKYVRHLTSKRHIEKSSKVEVIQDSS
jgi:hypothetical protein